MTDYTGAELRTVVNVRDLGGLPLVAGGETRGGVLLRSDAPYSGDLAPAHLPWPPGTVIDLRDDAEAGHLSATWPDDVRRISNPLFSGARLDRMAHTKVVDLYAGMLKSSAVRITGALNGFDSAGTTLVHCAAGKDRTGVVIAVALMLAGVDTEAIIADYVRTEAAIADIYERLRQRKRLPAGARISDPIFRSPRDAVELVIEQITGHSGGVWGWVEEHGGRRAPLERWVSRFTCATEQVAPVRVPGSSR